MAEQEYPTLNGIAPSWADIATSYTIYGGKLVEMRDFSDLSWSDTVEVGEQRGASGGRVMKRTAGAKSSEAACTMYRSGYRQLVKALMEKAPLRGNQRQISLVGFDILIQHTPVGETEIYVTKLKGCRLLGRSYSTSEGSDADKLEVTLNPLEIADIVDGVEVVLL